MSPSIEPPSFACDYCRNKKLRCSKELPKCSNCKPWPGTCQYSRTSRKYISRVIKPTQTTKEIRGKDSIEDRLTRIETSIESLTAAISSLTEAVYSRSNVEEAIPDQACTSNDEPGSPVEQVIKDKLGTQWYFGPSHAFSLLSRASSQLECLRSMTNNVSSSPEDSVPNLDDDLAALHFEDDIRESMQHQREVGKAFYIPDRQSSEVLISKFLNILHLGCGIFLQPPEKIIQKIVFEPSRDEDRAWVVIFNCLLCTTTRPTDPESAALKSRLRWNTWLALDNARLVTYPCEINIQALLFLACNAEELVTPSLSWIIVGHACRLAQGMGLHHCGSLEPEVRDRRLHIFWILFLLDKSLSLAFGRPPVLAGKFYEDVPIPTLQQLQKFPPYSRFKGNYQEGATVKKTSGFGAILFLRWIHLSKLTEKIADLLYCAGKRRTFVGSTDSVQRVDGLKEDLDRWYQETEAVMLKAQAEELPNSAAGEQRELSIGMNSIRFQYYHIRVLLTRHNKNDKSSALFSAREAITVLGNLGFGTEQVHDGLVWQFLYYPLTPFFVVYENVMKDPHAAGVSRDMDLLYQVDTYLSTRASRYKIALKLCKVAKEFISIAETRIKNIAEQKSYNMQSGMNQGSEGYSEETETTSATTPHTDLNPSSTSPEISSGVNILDSDLIMSQDTSWNSQFPGASDLETLIGGDFLLPFDSMAFEWISWDLNNSSNESNDCN